MVRRCPASFGILALDDGALGEHHLSCQLSQTGPIFGGLVGSHAAQVGFDSCQRSGTQRIASKGCPNLEGQLKRRQARMLFNSQPVNTSGSTR